MKEMWRVYIYAHLALSPLPKASYTCPLQCVPEQSSQFIGLYSESGISSNSIMTPILTLDFMAPIMSVSNPSPFEVCISTESVLAGPGFLPLPYDVSMQQCITLGAPLVSSPAPSFSSGSGDQQDDEPPIIQILGLDPNKQNKVAQCGVFVDPGATACMWPSRLISASVVCVCACACACACA